MKKSAAFLAALSLQTCAPPKWSDPPTKEEQQKIDQTVEEALETIPLAEEIMKRSHVGVVDIYGEEATPKEAAQGFEDIADVLEWFLDNDRIRLFDAKVYPKKAGQYHSKFGNEYRNDWMLINCREIEEAHVYVHETIHAFSNTHSEEMDEFLHLSQEEKTNLGKDAFQMALEIGDPAYLFADGIYEAAESISGAVWYDIPDPNDMLDVATAKVSQGLSPQEAYNFVKDYFRPYPEGEGIYPTLFGRGVELLKLSFDDVSEIISAIDGYEEAFWEAHQEGLNKIAENYPDEDIETDEERRQSEERKQREGQIMTTTEDQYKAGMEKRR